MSHITRIQTQLTEKAHLLQALRDLGFRAEEGQLAVRGFRGQESPVDIRVAVPLSYDIGFRKNGIAYEAVADWNGVQGLQPQAFLERLSQRYAYHAAKEKLAAQGFTLVEEQVNETGQIRLLLRRLGQGDA
jgi:hypothetical protein